MIYNCLFVWDSYAKLCPPPSSAARHVHAQASCFKLTVGREHRYSAPPLGFLCHRRGLAQ